MNKILGFALGVFVFLSYDLSAAFADWDRTFGGANEDSGRCVQQTSDGGFIIVGTTESYGAGGRDVWLIKTDSTGVVEWDQTFGGTESEEGSSVQQTSDGGYVIVGGTFSFGAGSRDVWLIKTDSNGVAQWDQTFGGTESEEGYSVKQTNDGGYIIAASERSGELSFEAWLIKTDSNGAIEWDQTFSGDGVAWGFEVQQTMDGGYVVTGTTSDGGLFSQADAWMLKTDSTGILQWERTFGGTGDTDNDTGNSVQQTSDGGYVIVGGTHSFGAGGRDVWLIKTDSSGVAQWDQTFGGTESEEGYSVKQTSDGGFVVAGHTDSYGTDGIDAWLIKTDSNGIKQWDQTFAGPGRDEAYCVQQTIDGGYVIAGIYSQAEEDTDVWLIKVIESQLTSIALQSPADQAIISTPPTFEWIVDGGMSNVFAVDVSPSPSFSPYFSTFEHLHMLIHESSWTMPGPVWDMIPSGMALFWRVRGADLDADPVTIITSGETRWFYKP